METYLLKTVCPFALMRSQLHFVQWWCCLLAIGHVVVASNEAAATAKRGVAIVHHCMTAVWPLFRGGGVEFAVCRIVDSKGPLGVANALLNAI